MITCSFTCRPKLLPCSLLSAQAIHINGNPEIHQTLSSFISKLNDKGHMCPDQRQGQVKHSSLRNNGFDAHDRTSMFRFNVNTQNTGSTKRSYEVEPLQRPRKKGKVKVYLFNERPTTKAGSKWWTCDGKECYDVGVREISTKTS